MADKEEARLSLEKEDIYKVYWLNCNLTLSNPLLTVLLPKKIIATKERPRKIATFTANKKGVF